MGSKNSNNVSQKKRRGRRRKKVLIIIAVIAVAVILVLLFERGIGKSYRKAYKIVEDVANGHTDKRIPVKGSYELRQFAKDFNNIMDRAGMLDESRQEFVSNVSHELKTPISQIFSSIFVFMDSSKFSLTS